MNLIGIGVVDMKNLKLNAKLLLSFAIVIVINIITIVFVLNQYKIADGQYSDTLINYGFSQGDVGEVMVSIATVKNGVQSLVSYEQKEDLAMAQKEYDEAIASYREMIKSVEPAMTSKELKKEYDEAVVKSEAFFKVSADVVAMRDVIDTSTTAGYAKLEKALVGQLEPAYIEASEGWEKIHQELVTEGDTLSNKLTKTFNVTFSTLIIITIVVAIVAMGIAYATAKMISVPVKKCSERLEKLANGDLKSEVEVISNEDEIGHLTRALKEHVSHLNDIIDDEKYVLGRMSQGDMTVHTRKDGAYVGDFEDIILSIREIRKGLSEILLEVNEASEQVGIGSAEVASGAQELAQGATEQASAVEELNSTIANISKQVTENAENAMNASKIAQASENDVEEGNRQMHEMTNAMAEISETSNKIAKIIKTIDDIAFQTNILALNAAVEAARAGAAGKGFAVVADEVRNLAGKSAEAAKNTTELIESSIKAVENGTNITARTAETLNNVVTSSQKTAMLVNQIAMSSKEQAKSIDEVTKGIEQISTVVQTNSATSEQSAAASEELNCQSVKMGDLIGRFKLEGQKRSTVQKASFERSSSPSITPSVKDINSINNIDLGDLDSGFGGNSKY
ncbi:MAG: HAMP domain-containing protein [Lachnospiraceae bacterium]|nr:HAMP domain-containing protein [Lachnospiraceae bacterium]